MVLLRIDQQKCAPHFLSTSYLANIIEGSPVGKIWLENICVVHEMMVRDKDGNNSINVVYFTSNVVSEGRLIIREQDVFCVRDVADDETIMKGYRDAFAAYRQEKAGLSKVKSDLVMPGGRN